MSLFIKKYKKNVGYDRKQLLDIICDSLNTKNLFWGYYSDIYPIGYNRASKSFFIDYNFKYNKK